MVPQVDEDCWVQVDAQHTLELVFAPTVTQLPLVHWLSPVHVLPSPKVGEVHVLLTHEPDAHTVPQDPQLFGSLVVSTQAPLHAVPVVHVNPQVPAVQVALALAGAGQTCPQAPQLLAEVWRLTQVKPQVVGLQQELSPPLHFPPPAASAGSAITAAPAAPPIITPPNRRRASRRDNPSSSRRERPPASLRAKRSSRAPPCLGMLSPRLMTPHRRS